MYSSAKGSRTTGGFGASSTSADAELQTSLTALRSRSRQMVRDSSYAKRAKTVVQNNIIGSGVGMQSQVMGARGELRANINSAIEEAFCEWACAEYCHTGGALHFHDLERAAMGEVFETGECFIRIHLSKFGGSEVPLALELIEPERIAHEFAEPGSLGPNTFMKMGIEVDDFGRAIAYWVRTQHPGDIRFKVSRLDRYERVPAAEMFHLRVINRWPQTRGEPWMHTALRKIDDMNEATAGELAAVRASSYYFGTIKTPEGTNPLVTATETDGKQQMDIEPLTIQELNPGEEFDFHAPNRPNANLDAFLRHMLREMAAGFGVSYESISRDYSQSNYSSSRLALLEDRDLYKVIQLWWIRNFRSPLHKLFLQQAVLASAIPAINLNDYAADMRKFEAVHFKPRGWSWIDPTKEVNAYKEAIKAGLTTITDVIAATADGRDIEDVIATRRRELDMLEAAGIEVDTTVQDPLEVAAKAAASPATPQADPNSNANADPNADPNASGRLRAVA
jgi:lambda family phage portal protein